MSQRTTSRGGKLLSGILLIALCAGAALVFLIAMGFVDLEALLPAGGFFGIEPEQISGKRAIAAAAALIVGIAAAAMLLRGLFGSGSNGSRVHLIADEPEGTVVVAREGVERIAEAAVIRCTGVLEADVRVIGGFTEPVRLRIRAGVHGGANLQLAGRESRDAARKAVETMTGINVKDVSVSVGVLHPERAQRGLA